MEGFSGKTIEKIDIEIDDVLQKVVIIYFTDKSKMKIEVEATGRGFEFDELVMDISKL